MSKDLISASQVADFTYCARAYWLAQQGEKREISSAMKQGSAAHQELASVHQNGSPASTVVGLSGVSKPACLKRLSKAL